MKCACSILSLIDVTLTNTSVRSSLRDMTHPQWSFQEHFINLRCDTLMRLPYLGAVVCETLRVPTSVHPDTNVRPNTSTTGPVRAGHPLSPPQVRARMQSLHFRTPSNWPADGKRHEDAIRLQKWINAVTSIMNASRNTWI